ncbi:MAG: TetR/AcrR family transcriptional regulator C-terminal domain-containing protein [Tetrasphaera sp.]
MSGGQKATAARRAGLSRAKILHAAIAFVDKHDLAALSMRRLGQELGVEAMALYYYVNGRDDLLEGIVELLMEEVRVPPRTPLGPADGWQAYVIAFAQSVRESAIEHPKLFPLVATRPPEAPWLRPPLRHLPMVEDFLQALVIRGLSDDAAAQVYKIFAAFLLGHLLLEVSLRGAELVVVDDLDDGQGQAPVSDLFADYPTLTRLQGPLAAHDPDAEFGDALEALLERLEREVGI